jgi:3-hydroxyacyl-CoA dehydrogenase
MPVVSTTRHDNIALIAIDNPPVNAASNAMRAGLLAAIDEALADPAIAAIVLACQGKTFVAGADVREFDQPPAPPMLPEIIDAIEGAAKPVIAAIHGTALGGGFEIALGCHWRVAAAGAKVGLPEVMLGLIPGAGGTQRLPRLVGIEAALDMITSGKPVSAEKAHALGAIDEIATGDLREAALAFTRRVVAEGRPARRTRDLPPRAAESGTLERALGDIARKARGRVAPMKAAEAVQLALHLPFDEAAKREREMFLELRNSPQARALRHAFFGEREVARIPDLPEGTPVREIRCAAVIGAGTMGGGIAMCFANAGLPVTLVEATQEALDRGMATIRRNYAATVAKGSLAQEAMDRRLALISPTLSYEKLRDADIVIEAVFEEIGVKQAIFEKIDALARPGAILATNTSYLDVAKIATFTNRPADVVGTHFFSPANVMRLLENVRTAHTAPDVQASVMKLGKALGKVAVMVGGKDGFVGNRMLAQRTREAFFLIEEGALPQQVDKVLTDFGFPMGHFAVSDLAGVDIGWRVRKANAHLRKPELRDCNLVDQICELGRFGQKTGAGWYRYETGSRVPLPDPLVEKLIVEHSRAAGIQRRAITDEEILGRLLYAMINEGARILAEGVALRAVDIDMVWLHGYGFPAHRGGPMFHADETGLKTVLEAIRGYRDRFGADFWTPAPLLEELADSGGRFQTWGRKA